MSSEGFSRRHREGLLSAVSVGFFLVLVGLLFVVTPNLSDKIVAFFQDIKAVNVPHLDIVLPAPANVGEHSFVYSAVQQFSLAWGVFLVAMLVMRFVAYSPIRRKAENLGDIVFWFGTAYVIQTWLIERTKWFEFWAWILILLGMSLIVRAIFLVGARAIRR